MKKEISIEDLRWSAKHDERMWRNVAIGIVVVVVLTVAAAVILGAL